MTVETPKRLRKFGISTDSKHLIKARQALRKLGANSHDLGISLAYGAIDITMAQELLNVDEHTAKAVLKQLVENEIARPEGDTQFVRGPKWIAYAHVHNWPWRRVSMAQQSLVGSEKVS